MALKKKPVTGMKDVMPAEMEIRDYLIGLIKDTYKTFGFQSMETPCVCLLYTSQLQESLLVIHLSRVC